MIKKIDIFIFSLLLFLYIVINEYHLYFVLIYIPIIIYYLFKLYRIIRFESESNISIIIKFVGFSTIHFLFSYFIICDPNPIYYLITFYFPFPNFFKALFIYIFHSYRLAKFDMRKNKEKNKFMNAYDSKYNIILTTEVADTDKIEYFLSDIFHYFKNNKKNIFRFIFSLIIIKIILFYYYSKFWLFINSKEKVLPLSTSKNVKYYITSCVFNMEPIIADYINEMKKLINYLGEQNIIVSIVENGDSTDNTRDYLKEFKQYLDSKNIINKFILTPEVEDQRKKNPNIIIVHERMEYLAILRNKCFDLLYQTPNLDLDNIKVINFNDIVFSYEDIIKLLSTNNEDFDVACAMDYYFNFYDSWVSIDLDGEHFLDKFPYFKNKEGQDQYINKKPIRVFSCWNGVIAFNASALKNQNLKFRFENKVKDNKKEICKLPRLNQKRDYESECSYFNIDMETLGFKKRFLNPDVRVAYNYINYYFSKYILPNTFELFFYFENYFKSFYIKRNKNMSNIKNNNLTYPTILYNWHRCHKLD